MELIVEGFLAQMRAADAEKGVQSVINIDSEGGSTDGSAVEKPHSAIIKRLNLQCSSPGEWDVM